MNTLFKSDGFSARRMTIKPHIDTIFCGRVSAVLLALFMLLASCDGKTKVRNVSSAKLHDRDSIKPKVNISVNRHYDEKGKVVGFDSVYSSYYSNVAGDTIGMDSIMHRFDNFFNQNHSSFFQNEFNPLFFNDTSRYPDFFHDDFFMKRYELNDKYMRSMMDRMDSIKNQFYKEQNGNKKHSKTL